MSIHAIEDQVNHLIIDDAELRTLKAAVRGTVISREDAVYDEERKVYNGMIDKHPALIIKCRDVADVITAVKFGRDRRALISIRGGGHNAAGLGVCDDGIVIDLSLMKGVRVDRERNTVRVEGGCLLGDVDHATQIFGKAVPSGVFSTTGVSGLTLGGGIGYLSRTYGLAIDNLLEADMVLADGSFVTVSDEQHRDLFWAIRGGGGNFGVVTSFLFKIHDAGTVYGGPMLWHLEEAETMMKYFRDFILNADKHIYCYFAFLTVPPVPIFPAELHLKKMCGVIWCNTGDMAKAADAVETFRHFKTPALDFAAPIPFATLQSLFDALYPKGLQWYWRADFIKDISDEAVQLNVKYANRLPTPHSTMHLYPIDAACHAKANDETAFAYRDANFAQVMVGIDPDPANAELISTWAKEYWIAIHPFSAGGAYVNFMMDEGEERVKASYRGNYERLLEVKTKYDPENVFRVNQNIRPRV